MKSDEYAWTFSWYIFSGWNSMLPYYKCSICVSVSACIHGHSWDGSLVIWGSFASSQFYLGQHLILYCIIDLGRSYWQLSQSYLHIPFLITQECNWTQKYIAKYMKSAFKLMAAIYLSSEQPYSRNEALDMQLFQIYAIPFKSILCLLFPIDTGF